MSALRWIAAVLSLYSGLALADGDGPRPWAQLLATPESMNEALDHLAYAGGPNVSLSAAATGRLAELAAHADWNVRRRALLALGRAQATPHLAVLLAGLRDAEPLVRDAATEAIPWVGPPALPALERQLATPADPAERVTLTALALLAGGAADPWVARLDDSLLALTPGQLRGPPGIAALRAFQTAASWPAAQAVLGRVREGHWSSAALSMLSAVADPRAEGALRDLLSGPSPEACAAAIAALSRRAAPPSGALFAPFAGTGHPLSVRVAAIEAIARVRAAECAPAIGPALLATEAPVSTAAAGALRDLGDAGHAAAAAALRDRYPRLATPLELVPPGGSVSLGDSGAPRDEALRRLFASATTDRQARLGPGSFGLVKRLGSHTWTVAVFEVARAEALAAIDGTHTLAQLGQLHPIEAYAAALLALQSAGLVDWAAAPSPAPSPPFALAGVPGAGREAPAVAGIVPCFWAE